MEVDRLLDMQVPVSPVVFAGIFRVLVRNMQRFQMFMEIAVVVDEEILLAAVDPDGRNPAMIDLVRRLRTGLPALPWDSGRRSAASSCSNR